MSSALCFITLVLMCDFLHKCNTVYVGDSVTRMKMKLLHMDRELLLNAIRNVQRVNHIREYYTFFPTYDIGRLIYRMRSKFAKMTRLYISSIENLDVYSHNKLIENMNEIQKIALEMLHLVEVIEEWEAKADKRKQKLPSYLQKANATFTITNTTKTMNVQFRNQNMGKGKGGLRNKASIKPFTVFMEGFAFDSDLD